MADEILLPTEEEIAQLPRWARVAFAARCARRVLPLFQRYWPNAPAEHLAAVTQAIDLSEQAAARAVKGVDDAATTARAANSAAHIANSVGNANANANRAARAATSAAVYAADAATRAAYAAYAADAATRAVVVTQPAATDAAVSDAATYALNAADAADAATYATDVASYAGDTAAANAREDMAQSIVRDFKTILSTARTQNWSDSTAVPPSVFGPLWPDGPPPEWPAEDPTLQPVNSPAFTKIAIKALIKPDVAPETVRDGLIELYRAMNEYHIASGAGVLTLEDFRRFVRAEVAVEV